MLISVESRNHPRFRRKSSLETPSLKPWILKKYCLETSLKLLCNYKNIYITTPPKILFHVVMKALETPLKLFYNY
jgi:hypothetical protein